MSPRERMDIAAEAPGHETKKAVEQVPDGLICHGGDKGVRTPDLVTASHALSQLSYIPNGGRCWIRTSDPFRVKEVLYP